MFPNSSAIFAQRVDPSQSCLSAVAIPLFWARNSDSSTIESGWNHQSRTSAQARRIFVEKRTLLIEKRQQDSAALLKYQKKDWNWNLPFELEENDWDIWQAWDVKLDEVVDSQIVSSLPWIYLRNVHVKGALINCKLKHDDSILVLGIQRRHFTVKVVKVIDDSTISKLRCKYHDLNLLINKEFSIGLQISVRSDKSIIVFLYIYIYIYIYIYKHS